jgi:hypothetical protein
MLLKALPGHFPTETYFVLEYLIFTTLPHKIMNDKYHNEDKSFITK